MVHCDRLLSLTAWTLVVACSGGRNETLSVGSAGGEAGTESPPLECERFDEMVAEGG